MFERVVYVSRAVPGIGTRDAYDIVRVAHNRNSRSELTGALLFLDGWFAQVLEGDALQLHERFSAIAADPRHHAIEVREWAPVQARRFGESWMALRGDDALTAAVKARFGYEPGLPAQRFPPERLVDFVEACVRARVEPAVPAAGPG
ncbi:MAG: BLUF domain-containing protein [Rubrivivax sp.]|nr:BLUF domain-containing protein [Rubrivivax sp.]